MTTPSQKPLTDEADGVRVGQSPVPGLTLHRILRGHESTVTRLEWSPDGQYLASSSEDATVRIWDTANLSVQVLGGYRPLHAVAWSHDGKLLAFQDEGNHILVRAVPTGSKDVYKSPFAPKQRVWGLSWSPDNSRLAVDNIIWQFAAPHAPVEIAGVQPELLFE